MHKKFLLFLTDKKHYTTIIVFIAILLLGIFLRHDKFRTIPRHGATFDEFAWTWLGINLIQKGVPISWSPQPQYRERQEIKYQGAAFLIVRPYLEHPPFFGLVAGSFALINGVRDMYDVTLEKIRPLALGLGILSIFLIFLLVQEIYGKGTAIFASLLYATVPTIVIGSRIVQNENFLIPFWLLSLYLISKYLKTGKKRFRNIASILAGLLSLAKVPWLVVGLSLSMILSYKGKWRDAIFTGSVTLLIFSLFIIYGIYFDKELFFSLWGLQFARYDISFSGFFSIFTNPLLVDRYYLDGWILFSWFAIFLLLKDLKKYFIVLIPFIAYLVVYIFAIPNEPAHGWYRYPFYPFLIISTALILKEEFKKISLISMIFLLLIGLSLLSNTWQNLFGFSYTVYRLFILSAALPIIFILWKNIKGKISSILIYSWLIIFLISNIAAVLLYVE
jgi:4-amino-4-deoxy-L-arabinose transferase-like glycosyltransferase